MDGPRASQLGALSRANRESGRRVRRGRPSDAHAEGEGATVEREREVVRRDDDVGGDVERPGPFLEQWRDAVSGSPRGWCPS